MQPLRLEGAYLASEREREAGVFKLAFWPSVWLAVRMEIRALLAMSV